MKKLFAILLAAILCLGLLAGCGQTTIIVNMGGEDDTPTLPRPPKSSRLILPPTRRLRSLTTPRCPRVSSRPASRW